MKLWYENFYLFWKSGTSKLFYVDTLPLSLSLSWKIIRLLLEKDFHDCGYTGKIYSIIREWWRFIG